MTFNYRDHAVADAAARGWEHVSSTMTFGATRVTVDEFRKPGKRVVATFMNFRALTEWSDYWTLGHFDFGDVKGRIEAVQSGAHVKAPSLERVLDGDV
ncbi:hypothetical protein ACIP98_15200 [Streptomyces sp. NPDC088354]|uniref:hypothetical protein n=1 Tax=Streptomyces sp. NPDC088354 TaxID=3365856 RepID=UPI00380D67E1